MKLHNYVLLQEEHPTELAIIVERLSKEGWELYGNPFVILGTTPRGRTLYHYQAMVRYI